MGTENVLRNLRLVDGRTVDISIQDGIITAITPPGQAEGRTLLDCSGLYGSSGWIDLHVHAVPELDPYGDVIDEIGVKQGVTTVVDAGSCGADRIGDFIVPVFWRIHGYSRCSISQESALRGPMSSPSWTGLTETAHLQQ